MKIGLFGLGTTGVSKVISAQRRVNCYIQKDTDPDKTPMALIGSPGLTLFNSDLSGASRGAWAVNSLATPLVFTVNGANLYSINNASVSTLIGTIGTTTGNVSLSDDGTFLVLVDGTKGYVYNMRIPAGLNAIVDGNFTTHPQTVTWQDTYFIVNDAMSNQFQLSANGDPTTWPAVNIGFTGSNAGAIQAVLADHSVLNVFGGAYSEFWQDSGNAGLPYDAIPGSAQEFGLKSPWSLCKFDNSMAGLFVDKQGGINISRMAGFRLDPLSTQDIDTQLQGYSNTANALGFSYTNNGHPMYLVNFPDVNTSLEFDGRSKTWGERQEANGGRYWGNKFANLVNRRLVFDYRNGNVYQIDNTVFTDNGTAFPMEVTSKHIWSDDKYITVTQLQIDIEQGVGLTSGQGSDPQMMLEVSKDGGRNYTAVSWNSMGKLGQYTRRCIWHNLGAARDWVLRLRVTDPVRRVITGATANAAGGSF